MLDELRANLSRTEAEARKLVQFIQGTLKRLPED